MAEEASKKTRSDDEDITRRSEKTQRTPPGTLGIPGTSAGEAGGGEAITPGPEFPTLATPRVGVGEAFGMPFGSSQSAPEGGEMSEGEEYNVAGSKKRRKRSSPKKDAGAVKFDKIMMDYKKWVVSQVDKKRITVDARNSLNGIMDEVSRLVSEYGKESWYWRVRCEELTKSNMEIKAELEKSREGTERGEEDSWKETLLSEMKLMREEIQEIKAQKKEEVAAIDGRRSYADSVGRTPAVKCFGCPIKIDNRKDSTILVYPEKDDKGVPVKTSKETREEIKKVVKPGEEEIRVRVMRNIGGGGVVIQTSTPKEAKSLREKEGLGKAGLRVVSPRMILPKVYVSGVPDDDNDELTKKIWRQNISRKIEGSTDKDLKILRKSKGFREGEVNLIVEVKSGIRNILVAEGRCFVDWSACRVRDFTDETRCYKCNLYGHVAKYCRGETTCGHCAQKGHEEKNCKNKDKDPVCPACSRVGMEASHSGRSRECESWQRAVEDSVRRTSYE